MNPDIRTLWLEALRSGRYLQGQNLLCYVPDFEEPDVDRQYCCLGVLCDLAVQAAVIPQPKLVNESESSPHRGARLVFENETERLPQAVMEWAQLPHQLPDVTCYDHYDEQPFELGLAELNDSGRSFLTLADYIEESL